MALHKFLNGFRLAAIIFAAIIFAFAAGVPLAARAGESGASSGGATNECASTVGATGAASCYTAGTSSSGTAYLYYAPPNGDPTEGNYIAARSDPGGAINGGAVDVWGYCRYVNNISSSVSLFVPFRSQQEWLAFINHAPPSRVSFPLPHCARATAAVITAGPDCKSPQPAASQTVQLPYAPTGSSDVETVTFKCQSSPECAAPTWTQTVTASYLGLDSDIYTPSWQQSSISYSAPPPTCNPGTCGEANGLAVSSAPVSGLCSTGTPSAVAGSGPWSWSCVGSQGGITASCDAAVAAINGSCGASNGTLVSSAPASGLCATGTASAVAGSGPWSWSCVGSGGGTTATCATTACSASVLGSTCATAAATANTSMIANAPQAFLYQFPQDSTYTQIVSCYSCLTAAVGNALLTAADRIKNLIFYPSEIDVPLQGFSGGFPGYPQLTQWFGVCYDGGFQVPSTGTYIFALAADDGASLYIDGVDVLDVSDAHDIATYTFQYPNIVYPVGYSQALTLSAGLHDIELKYWNGPSNAEGWIDQIGIQLYMAQSANPAIDDLQLYSPVSLPWATLDNLPAGDLNWVEPPATASSAPFLPLQLVGPPNGQINCPH